VRHYHRLVVGLLSGLALAIPLLFAEQQAPASAMIRYDVDSTTLTYCRAEGTSASVIGSPIAGPARVKTTGSSTTVESNTALSSALAPVVARDILFVRPPSSFGDVFAAGWAAVVTVKTDANTVTVDPAVGWNATGGYAYTYLKTVCGTTVNDGWVDVAGATKASITIQYDQGDLDALAWRFECKQNTPGSSPIVVYPSEGDDCGIAGTLVSGFCEFATAGPTANLTWEEFGAWGSCRIGFKYKTTDTSDAGAALERVTGTVVVSR
jgi:hypothetical protein